jgi:CheY-like chemotaxis protein
MVKIREQRTLQGFMAPAKLESEQAHRIVVQAIDRVATPEQRDAVLHAALVAADETEVPSNAGKLAAFLLGPLRDEIAAAISPTEADLVVRSLKPLLGLQAAQAGDDQPAADPELAEADSGRQPPEQPVTVLIVDDDIQVRSQVARILQKNGCGAVSAPNLDVALAMCVRYSPQLIVAELEAGSERSKKFSALLQVAFGEEAPPVVTMTTDIEAARAKPDVGPVIAKPIVEDELIEAVEQIVGGAGRED